ncbi:uncharacterized protein LOC119349633 [Triticum dicoccoides]|uniref:uncharacterized protein LOC119349633 n=1 Tax=Triticum dicoccoides TaxID=85692 RepID=UPI00188EAD65|nr:uncharacterized protein LOC119349633 [Triticum dicoccoides]
MDAALGQNKRRKKSAGCHRSPPQQSRPSPANQPRPTDFPLPCSSIPFLLLLPCPAAVAVAVSRRPPPPPSRSDSSAHQSGFGSLAPKTKNVVVAGGLTGFVFGVYYYTMWAVGSTDELQVTIDKFEDLKKKEAAASAAAASASTPGSS